MREYNSNQIGQVYNETILDHYKNSSHKIFIDSPDLEFDEFNPVCGDRVFLQIRLAGGKILKAGFLGEGCIITQASASMMIENLIGKTLDDAESTSFMVKQMMSTNHSIKTFSDLGSLVELQSVKQIPIRIKCAVLAWSALEQCIDRYRKNQTY